MFVFDFFLFCCYPTSTRDFGAGSSMFARRSSCSVCSAVSAVSAFPSGRDRVNQLEDGLNVDRIPDRRSISTGSWPEFQRHQHVAELPVVAAVTRWIKSQKFGVAPLVDIEVGGEVISPY